MGLDGKPVAKSPYKLFVDAPDGSANWQNSYAEGPGLEDGNITAEPTHYTIHTVDKNGNPLKQGGSPVAVEIIGPDGSPVDADLKDNNDGTYTVTYHATEPGDYTVESILRNPFSPSSYEHVKNSPKTVHIEPGTDPNASYLMDLVLKMESWILSQPISLSKLLIVMERKWTKEEILSMLLSEMLMVKMFLTILRIIMMVPTPLTINQTVLEFKLLMLTSEENQSKVLHSKLESRLDLLLPSLLLMVTPSPSKLRLLLVKTELKVVKTSKSQSLDQMDLLKKLILKT